MFVALASNKSYTEIDSFLMARSFKFKVSRNRNGDALDHACFVALFYLLGSQDQCHRLHGASLLSTIFP